MNSLLKNNPTTIQGITEFKIANADLIYTNHASLKNRSLFINEKLIYDGKLKPEGGVTSFSYFDGHLYFSTWSNATYKYSIQFETIEEIPFMQVSLLSNEDYLILKRDSKLHTVQESKSQITFDIESRYLVLKSILIDYFLFSAIEKEILCLDIKCNTLIWQLNISDVYNLQLELGSEKHGEVRQFIGVYNNLLWVLLNGGRFIGIDLQSGEVRHFIRDTMQSNIYGTIELHPKGLEKYLSPSDSNFYHLDQQVGKIIAESARGIWEICLTQTEPYLQAWGMIDQYKQFGLEDVGYKTVLRGNELYFIDFNALKWGVIDLLSKKIKWVSDKITNEKTQLKEIQCGGNKVYVLDGMKTLYVFEMLVS